MPGDSLFVSVLWTLRGALFGTVALFTVFWRIRPNVGDGQRLRRRLLLAPLVFAAVNLLVTHLVGPSRAELGQIGLAVVLVVAMCVWSNERRPGAIPPLVQRAGTGLAALSLWGGSFFSLALAHELTQRGFVHEGLKSHDLAPLMASAFVTAVTVLAGPAVMHESIIAGRQAGFGYRRGSIPEHWVKITVAATAITTVVLYARHGFHHPGLQGWYPTRPLPPIDLVDHAHLALSMALTGFGEGLLVGLVTGILVDLVWPLLVGRFHQTARIVVGAGAWPLSLAGGFLLFRIWSGRVAADGRTWLLLGLGAMLSVSVALIWVLAREGSSPKRIFLSHAHEDEHLASLVRRVLVTSLTISEDAIVFTSEVRSRVKAGEDFHRMLREWLWACPVGVAVVTPKYRESPYCLMELGGMWALNLRAIPFTFDRATITGLGPFENIQAVMLLEDRPEEALREAIDTIGREAGLSPRPPSDASREAVQALCERARKLSGPYRG